MMPWYMYVAEGFGLGRLPVAPGTWGSLGGLILAVPFVMYLPEWIFLWVILLAVAGSIPLCEYASLYMAQEDPSNVVFDEIVGQWIAVYPVFWIYYWSSIPKVFIMAFLFFRFFDVLKIFPINYFDRLSGGLGIASDDWMAGFYTNLCLCLLGFFSQ